MSRKLHLCLLLALLTMVQVVQGQTTVLNEDFETGSLPVGWTQTPLGVAATWSVNSNGIQNLSAQGGTYYASLSASSMQPAVKLQTPTMDLSGLSHATLSFWYVQPGIMLPGYSESFDTLKVYYRSTSSDSWVLQFSGDMPKNVWTQMQIPLTDVTLSTTAQFAFEHHFGNGRGIGLDNITVGDVQLCTQPTGLQAYRVMDNSTELNWSASAEAMAYHLKISTTPLLNMSTDANVLDTIVYYKPYPVNGLMPSTTYYFYVESDCGDGDVSPWSAAGSFTTLCAGFSVPLTENFDSSGVGYGSFPTCWTQRVIQLGDWSSVSLDANYVPYCDASLAYSGQSSLKLSGYFNEDMTSASPIISSAYAVTPLVAVNDMSTLTLDFWMYSTSRNYNLHVGVMSDPDDASTFEELCVKSIQTPYQWEQVHLPLAQSVQGGKFLAFKVDGSDGENYLPATVHIDNVQIGVTPACPAPLNIHLLSNGANQVVLTWDGENSSAWNVKISTMLMSDMTQQADVANWSGATNTHLFSGLQPETHYYVYVQSDCSVDGMSSWSTGYEFTTSCAAVVDFPLSETFDSSSQFPLCWSSLGNYLNGTDNFPMVYSDDYENVATSLPNVLAFASDGFEAQYAIGPSLHSTINSLQLSFNLKNSYNSRSGRMEVGVMSNPLDTATFTTIACLEPSTDGYVHHQFYLKDMVYPGVDNHIAFRFVCSDPDNKYYLDDVVVDSLPGCIPPLDLTVDSIRSDGAKLCWHASMSESAWNIKVSSSKLLDPENEIGDGYSGRVTADSLYLTGLSMGTEYYIYIQSDCGSETSSWQSYSFETSCGDIVSLPYDNIFIGEQGEQPLCWNSPFVDSSVPYIDMYNDHTGGSIKSGSLSFYCDSYSGINDQYAVLPRVNVSGVSLQQMQLSFDLSTNQNEGIIVGVMTDPSDVSTFVPVDTIWASLFFDFENSLEVPFASYTGTGQYIALEVTTSLTGVGNLMANVDNLLLELIPACARPINIHQEQISSHDVTIAWTPRSSESHWEVLIGEHGFNPDTATTILVSQPNYSFTGLMPFTTYDVYVRANCGATDGVSIWSIPYSIKTLAVPDTLPFITDFESESDNDKWLLINEDQANVWSFGPGAANGGLQGMYVADATENLINDYNQYEDSKVIAARLLHFDQGAYHIHYDWRCDGEERYDYGLVCLVDDTVKLRSGDDYGMSSYQEELPLGWLNLNEGRLQLNNQWISKDTILAIPQAGNYYFLAYWVNDASGGNGLPLALDNVRIEKMECAPAFDFKEVGNPSSVVLSWSNLVPANHWDVKVSSVPLTHPDSEQGNTFNDTTLVSQVTLTGLLPQTTYYCYVRTHCNDGSMLSWSNYTFTSECTSIEYFPYRTDFENDALLEAPTCWTVAQGALNQGYLCPLIDDEQNHTFNGTKSLLLMASQYGDNVIASPRITGNQMSHIILNFSFYTDMSINGVEVGVMTNPDDITTFVPVDTIVPLTEQQWQDYSVSMNRYNGDGQFIAFRLQDKFIATYLDDVEIVDDRSCLQPSNLYVSHLTTQNGKLLWSTGDGNATYSLKVSTAPISPEKEMGDVLNDSNIQNQYYALSELTANTTYYFYVQADCGDSLPSYWSDGFQFTIPCEDQSIPYRESFGTTNSNETPNCWLFLQNKIGAVSHCLLPAVNESVYKGWDSKSLSFSAVYEQDPTDIGTFNSVSPIVVLPKFDADLSKLYLRFNNYSKTVGAQLKIGVLSDAYDLSTFEIVDTITLGDWQMSSISFANYQGQPGQIALWLDAVQNQKSIQIFIDDVQVDSVSSCQAPLSLTCSQITNDGAVLNWIPLMVTDSVWHVQVTTFNAGFNTNELDRQTSFDVDTVVHGTSLTLSGLNSRTTYYYYVRPVCSDGSEGPRFSVAQSFRTDCGALALPYTESFDTYGTGVGLLPECWRSYNTDSIADHTPYIARGNGSAPGALNLCANENQTAYAVLPEFIIDSVKHLEVNFLARTSDVSNALDVGVMTDPNDLSTFQLVNHVMLNSAYAWQEVTANLSNYYGSGQYIAFVYQGQSMEPTSFMVDEVLVQQLSTCYRPTRFVVSVVGDSSVSLTWKPNYQGEQFDVVVIPSNGDVNEATPVSTSSASLTITGLQLGTSYQAYIRSNCGAGDVSAWRGPLQFTTNYLPAQLPLVETFEDDHQGWILKNGDQNNQFFIGAADACSGVASLYVSGDDGASTSYDKTAQSIIFAYRKVHFAPGTYLVSYDWKCMGMEGLDYATVYLVPAAYVPSAGRDFRPSVENLSNYSNLGECADMNTWNNQQSLVTMASSGDYNLVVEWNNIAYAGLDPALAIDNIKIDVANCYTPVLSLASATDTSVVINMNTANHSVRVQVFDYAVDTYSLDSTDIALFDSVMAAPQVAIANLQPGTTYWVLATMICPNGEMQMENPLQFNTSCLPVTVDQTSYYIEDFDSYSELSEMSCWTFGTNNESYNPSPTFDYDFYSAPNALNLNIQSQRYTYAALPAIVGTPINQLQLTFKGSQMQPNFYVLVGVMSNPLDVNSFVLVDSLSCLQPFNWEDFRVSFADYNGNGKNIAFKVSGPESIFSIDDVEVSPVESCAIPTGLTASNITNSSFNMHWTHQPTDSVWAVKVFSEFADVDVQTTADVLDTVIATPYLTLSGLLSSSKYSVVVRNICSSTEQSNWSKVKEVYTLCPIDHVPFVESFSAFDFPPSCWSRSKGYIDGTLTLNDQDMTMWESDNSGVLTAEHAMIPVQGSSCNNWLITPLMVVDSSAVLSFDLAMTELYMDLQLTDLNGMDDKKFAVVISTDKGTTWPSSNMTLWSNDAMGDYSYANIAYAGQHVSVDLTPYVGDTIQIGFYAESTVNQGANSLHIDNVMVRHLTQLVYSDVACQYNAYRNYGFELDGSDLSLTGTNTYTRVVSGAEQDTMIVLNLTVRPVSITRINAAVCQGSTYTLNGFNVNRSGQYRLNLTSSNSCDSIVILNLTVQGGQFTENRVMCQSELPYLWHGQTISQPGLYRDTIINGLGCDSTFTLKLKVEQDYAVSDQVTIHQSELPYVYLDTLFDINTPLGANTFVLNRQTRFGCDSIVTLTLTVTSTGVGVNNVTAGQFYIYPNPVSTSQNAYLAYDGSETDLQDLEIRAYNSIGQCIMTIQPQQWPVRLEPFVCSGVFVIRITDKSGLEVWQKIIVH